MKKKITSLLLAAVVAAGAFALTACDSADGKDGRDGLTPTIGENGNWYIGDTDTGVGAHGTNGSVWFTGRGLPSANSTPSAKNGDFYINLNTNTIYRYDNGVWSVLVNVNENSNVSVWDGTIPGWQAPDLEPDEIIKNRPVSYVVDETAHTVDLYNAEAFAWFAYRAVIGQTGFAGYTVTLHCDVDLDNNMWIPIGLGARSNAAGVPFQGTFDGNGHTIYNLDSSKFFDKLTYGEYTDSIHGGTDTGYYVDYVNGDVNVQIGVLVNPDIDKNTSAIKAHEFSYGLFANSLNATFKNLTIENVNIVMPKNTTKHPSGTPLVSDSVGALVGFARGDVTVENCTVGSENGEDKVEVYSCAGGLVGRIYAGKGENADHIVDGKTEPYGKVVFDNCTNYAAVKVTDEKDEKAGGMVGYPHRFSALTVRDCTNYGSVFGFYAGGMVGNRQGSGDMDSPVLIDGCTNYGEITGQLAGGIMGRRYVGNDGSNATFVVTDCVNYGNILGRVIISNYVYIGGLFGSFDIASARGVVTDCFNYGTVKTDGTVAANVNAAGLIGHLNILVPANAKQGGIVINGFNCGDIDIVTSNEARNQRICGCAYVIVNNSLTKSDVYNEIYFVNNGTVKLNGEEQTVANS